MEPSSFPGRTFRTTGAQNNFGSFRQPELTARFELGVWLSARQTDSVSLLLGRRPLMLGTNPVGYMLSLLLPVQYRLVSLHDLVTFALRSCDAKSTASHVYKQWRHIDDYSLHAEESNVVSSVCNEWLEDSSLCMPWKIYMLYSSSKASRVSNQMLYQYQSMPPAIVSFVLDGIFPQSCPDA